MGGREGFIVVAVLAVLALLTGLLGALSLSVRSGIDAALTASEQVQLDALTRAGAALVAYELYGLKRRPDLVDGREIRLDGGTIKVRVEDESGKVDLNGSEPELLAGVYRAAGLDSIEPEVFAARVLAWRNRLPLSNGNRRSREPGFRSLGELRWLDGMSASDLTVLSDVVTVYNPEGKISPASAPETVLRAIPGLSPQTLERVLRLREAPSERSSEDLASLLRGQQAFLAKKTGRCFRIILDALTIAASRSQVRITTLKGPEAEALYYTMNYEVLY